MWVGGGGHGRRKNTHWYFVFFPVLLTARDQHDGGPSNSTINIYNLRDLMKK